MSLGSLQVQYINIKKELKKNKLTKDQIEDILNEKAIRKALAIHHASELLIIQTLLQMAFLKISYQKRKVSLMLLGFSESPEKLHPKSLVDGSRTFIPAYLDNKIHCIVCGELAWSCASYLRKEELHPDSRAFIYFTCEIHHPQNQSKDKQIEQAEKIEVVCEAYEKGILVKGMGPRP